MATSFELSPEAPQDAYEFETYGELRPAVHREWLLTNGLGGYACGTVADVATRRYHATLIAASSPPAGRVSTVSRWSCRLTFDGRSHDLWGGFFRYGLNGDGPARPRRFRLINDVAEWEFDVEGVKVFKQVFVCWHRNVTGVRYLVRPPGDRADLKFSLELSPFLALRSMHGLQRSGQTQVEVTEPKPGDVSVNGDEVSVGIRVHDAEDQPLAFEAGLDWWYGHTYPAEAKRGKDDREDLFTPGCFSAEAEGEAAFTMWSGLGELPSLDWSAEQQRRAEGLAARPMPTPTQRRLHRAAADFAVRRRRPDGMPGTTIIAGYPWSGDWGRDTFIALPGLLLSTHRHHLAGQVLSTFALYVSDGMIPSGFEEPASTPAYNAVDTSLWFINAAFAYLRETGDRDTFDAVFRPACEEIVDGYTRGTRHDIRVDPADGLVSAGDASTRLTWMDGHENGRPFTSRHGKAVEINALWFNALSLLEDERVDDVAASFREAFILSDGRGLADVVLGGPGQYDRDVTLRPNQIFAVSLRHSPLAMEQQRVVIDVVRRNLLTPFGLRTLATNDPRYRARFTGPELERQEAAHNGSVWPWLIGPFLDAHLKTNGRSAASIRRARTWLRPLIDHLGNNGCLGSLPEVVDAEHPYRPGACFAQAWSVAEVLRLAVDLEL